jgi:hypothetical protein
MTSPQVQIDLTHAKRAYVATFPTSADMAAWLRSHPLALHVCRAPGLLTFPGQVRAVVAEYHSPADHASASALLAQLGTQSRRQYLQASQAKVRLRRLAQMAETDLGKI